VKARARPMHRALRAAVAVAVLPLAACVVLPVPGTPPAEPGRWVADADAEALIPGVDTRATVLQRLGPPTDAAADGRWLEYFGLHSRGHWVILAGGQGGGVFGHTDEHYDTRTLWLHFDAGDRLVALQREADRCRAPCFVRAGEAVAGPAWPRLAAPGEALRERLPAVDAWRGEGWLPGSVVLTNRALWFLPDDAAAAAERLHGADLAAVEPGGAGAAAELRLPHRAGPVLRLRCRALPGAPADDAAARAARLAAALAALSPAGSARTSGR